MSAKYLAQTRNQNIKVHTNDIISSGKESKTIHQQNILNNATSVVNHERAELFTDAFNLAPNGFQFFTITNDKVQTLNDIVIANITEYDTGGTLQPNGVPSVVCFEQNAGSFKIGIHNIGSNTLNQTMRIYFEVVHRALFSSAG